MIFPRTSRTGVRLNIEPYSWVQFRRNTIDKLVDLTRRIFSSTRKHVSISGQSSSSHIFESLHYILINSSIWVISSGYAKSNSIVFGTCIVLNRKQLRNINTQLAQSHTKETDDHNCQIKFRHIFYFIVVDYQFIKNHQKLLFWINIPIFSYFWERTK